MKARGLGFGQLFGIGVVTLGVWACSGSAFKRDALDTTDPDTHDTNPPVANQGGSGAGGTGQPLAGTNAEPEGGAGGNEPSQPLGGSAGSAHAGTGGKGAGGSSGSGGGGSGGANVGTGGANAGTAGQSPDPGSAGDANLPDPGCQHPIAEDWSAALGPNAAWKTDFGDPHVDVTNHRLVVTYDDVASRRLAYEGGYYVSAEVTLNGSTVLSLYPYTNEFTWPSLRRTADGNGIELGSVKYGQSEHWSNTEWTGFSGVTLAETKSATVTMYVKATAQAAAVKVTHGDHAYRSGWISGFTWPATNLGIMRYIGENNSSVFVSNDGTIFVAPASGCQQLADAEVAALFAE